MTNSSQPQAPKLRSSKKLFIIALIILVGVLIVGFVVTKNNSDVVAKADGYSVTLTEATQRLRTLSKNNEVKYEDLSEESKKFIIQEEIANRMLVKEARKQNVLEQKEIDQKLKQFEENLLRSALIQKIAASDVTEENLKKTYDETVKKIQGQKEIKAHHILVKTKKEALDIKKKLEDTSFEELARKFSIDNKTATSGGNLGVMYTGTMLPEVEKVIQEMSEGEVSKPIETKFGWHIVRLDSRTKAVILPYEQAKQPLANDIVKQAFHKYISKLLKGVDIKLM